MAGQGVFLSGQGLLRPDPTDTTAVEVAMFVNRLRPSWIALWVGCVACETGAPPSAATPEVTPASALKGVAEPSLADRVERAAGADHAASSDGAQSPAAVRGEMIAPAQVAAGSSDRDTSAAQSGKPPAEDGDGSPPLAPDRVHPRAERGGALTEAYAGLARGEQERISELIAGIDAQAAANPDDRYAVFYAGVFRLWRLAEGELTLDALLGSLTNSEDMLRNLERAHALLPDDFRVTAFFGMAQVLVGGVMGDDDLLDEGILMLDHAVDQEPSYGHFLRAIGVSVLPANHERFHYVLDDMAAATVACKFPSGRDGAAYEYPTDDEVRSRVCLNMSVVPHVWEGMFLTYGDMALKAGLDAERARALYRSAKTSPDYDDWAYRDLLEQRITDADERFAALADDDPFNDPAVWAADGHVCTGCHEDVASLVAK